jgi:hypothetical protein
VIVELLLATPPRRLEFSHLKRAGPSESANGLETQDGRSDDYAYYLPAVSCCTFLLSNGFVFL